MLEEPSPNINVCIAQAFINCGYDIEINPDTFVFTPLELTIGGTMSQVEELRENVKAARLSITLDHRLFPGPIFEFVYGWGSSTKVATINAFERWIDSDFPVIHDFLADHKLENGHTSEVKIASNSGETGEQISWKGIIGPLLIFKGGEVVYDQENRNEIIKPLFEAITGDFLGRRGMYPIRCFMSKNSDQQIEVDCRVNGEEWKRGYDALVECCQRWEVQDYLFWKQYLLIYSLEGNLEEGDLKAQLEKEVRKASKSSRWKFWKK